jgi:hypothetical protein
MYIYVCGNKRAGSPMAHMSRESLRVSWLANSNVSIHLYIYKKWRARLTSPLKKDFSVIENEIV